jgi:2,5-diamino-6-(ribosylamino)-4(3H)-pyrimidinone 5'-phosphate reductase
MHVSVNAATSADGKLSSRRREQIKISGTADFERVDRLRAEADAIAVGIGTVLADDSSLVRHDERHRRITRKSSGPPARVVFDSTARTPTDAAVLDGEPTTHVLVSEAAPEARRDALRAAGAELIVAGRTRVDLSTGLSMLEARGIEQLLVEGGGQLIFSLFESELVDELTVYVGNLVIGGREAPTLADGEGFVSGFPELELDAVERLDSGALLKWTVP